MFSLPGYQIQESVYRSLSTTVFRARRDADDAAVIIKLCHENPAQAPVTGRAQREYQLLNECTAGQLPQGLDCLSCSEGQALVLNDCGGQPVDRLLDAQQLDNRDMLRIASGAAEALGALHAQGIVHRDIRPANLIYHRDSGSVQLIDLDGATRLARDISPLSMVDRFAAHPDYVAPEQTGRINRAVDYRSDFYSLGACLYHLFTGQPPFAAQDMAGLLHAHIARKPTPAIQLRPDLSPALSAILDKLLEKLPDDRYQSAFGLLADLRSAGKLSATQALAFRPGNQDVAGRFRILDHLYGRQIELARLREDYRKARNGTTRLTMISGAAGIGKTALVEALRELVVEDEGYFVIGKFDQFKRNEPYYGPIQALTSLVAHILSEDEAQVAQWRKHILNTMGDTCTALSGLIPELKAITGTLPTLGEVAGSEAMHRFNNAVRLLLQAISTFGKPVVMFLDDLHWADLPSLRTLGLMLRESELAHIHVICAWRDEEIGPGQPVRRLLNSLQEQDYEYSDLALVPLQQADVAQLLSDSLSRELRDCEELATLLHERTGGNPFFIRQMLEHLYEAGLFEFDARAGRWHWSLPRIAEAGYTNDVARFMAGQLQALAPLPKTLLQTAACIGAEFSLALLARVHEAPQSEVIQALWPALEKGLISLTGIDSGLLLIQDPHTLEQQLADHDVRLRFCHDRIAEAADQQLDDTQRAGLHLRIARLLKQGTIADTDSQRLYRLVSHYNRASRLLESEERLELAKLNLRAGRAIKAAGAHEIAYELLCKGLELLPEAPWQHQYPLCLALHQEAAELACLTADYAGMQALLETIEAQAHSALDKLPGYETRILSEIARNRPYEAVKTAIPLLAEFGLRLPGKPQPKHVAQGYLRTRLQLTGKSIERLKQLPEMHDPHYQAGVQLLSRVVSAAYFSSPLMLPLIILLLVRVSLREGLSPLSPFGFVGFGALICGAGNKPQQGLAYGELGLELARRPEYSQFANRARFLFGHYIEHWNRPLLQTCDSLQDAFEASLRAGDQEFTAYPAALYCMHAWFAGKPLDLLNDDMRDFGVAIHKTQHETARHWHEIYAATVGLLSQADSNPLRLVTAHSDEASIEALTPRSRDAGVGFHYRLNKLILCYLFGDLQQAEHYRRKAAVDLPYLVATPYIPVYHQYSALLALARYRENPDAALLRSAQRSLRLMRRWAANCKDNFEHKSWLIEAELARAHGHFHDAMSAYEKAIDGARRNAFNNDTALALELVGEYARQQGHDTQAHFYLREAIQAYRQWGALRKVADIEERYPQLAAQLDPANGAQSHDPRLVDVESVIKSARTLSSEIVLPRLVQKLMNLVMENSGADRAMLITRENEQMQVAAECTAQDEGSEPGPARSLDDTALAHTVLQYVARTHHPVLLNDALREGDFRADPHIRARSCRSLLCLPLLNHGELSGLLYLENNLITGAFTPDRLEVLTVLCSQAAVSLENARLYANITHVSQAYERFVPHDMLKLLHRDSILDVQLGDQVEGPMTALFTDIRSFTSLSERMTPEQNFAFLNDYLGRMSPIIRQHRGFVNRYLGDALLAIFPGSADDAVAAGIAMLQQLQAFNEEMQDRLEQPLRIGIGINTGPMMLGTVGEPDRMEGSILSDAVNVAARLENLTKTYRTPLLISGSTQAALSHHSAFATRFIGDALLRGRAEPVPIFEVFDADPEASRLRKRELQDRFDTALRNYRVGDHAGAATLFRELLQFNPQDAVVRVLLGHCEEGREPFGIPGSSQPH